MNKRDNIIEFFTFDSIDRFASVSCFVTSRNRGFSKPPFASLNLGMRCGDDIQTVRENRSQLSALTGAFPDLLTFGRQVHENHVAVVDGSLIGSGALDPETCILDTDAMVTNIVDVPLMVLVADCCPVLLYDPVKNVAGLAHAGWRGTVAGIASATVAKMSSEFGCRPDEIVAGVGPCIDRCCYEVGDEVYGAFDEAHPDLTNRVFGRGDSGNLYFDLPAANQLMLHKAGVADDNIETSRLCTSCNTNLFFSHRAEHGNTGRFGALIMLHGRTSRAY